MKRKLLPGIVASLICGSAYAQSSVTLYGLIDESIRYQSNPMGGTAGHGSSFGLAEGTINGTRFGFKGSENLGGGTSAIFDLQSGYNVGTGKSDQQGQLFGRYAWVGLANDTYGTLTMGRQYGGAFNFYAFSFDPIGGGNLPATDWELYLTGIRFDNTLQYSNNFGPVKLEVQHSFGGQPGSFSSGSTTTAALYDRFGSGGKVGIFGQESKDGNGHKLVVGSAGATYAFGPTTLYSYYIYARRDAGFAVGASGTSNPLANTNIMNNATTAYGVQTAARTDQFIRIGANYNLTSVWRFTLAGAYDHAQNVAPGRSGQLMTVYGMADYIFSKRTDIYLEVDENRAYGASVNDPNSPFGTQPGVRQVLGASLSLRTLF